MTKQELLKALEKLNWSDKEAAGKLGITRRSIYNYLHDKRAIPLYIDKAIQAHLKLYQISLLLK